MDMKKILQALDGASTKPVEGSSDMKSFMQIVEGKGPLNRLTTAESMAVNHYTEEKKTITNPVLNVAKDARPSMIGKYFKDVEQEIAEAADRSKDRARQLAERVIERVTFDPETGKMSPSFADQMRANGAQPSPEPASTTPMPGANLPRAEKANRDSQTVTVDGQEYEMVWLEPGGIRPRGGQKFALPMGLLGIRGIGNYIGIIVGSKAYMLPKGEQEESTEPGISKNKETAFHAKLDKLVHNTFGKRDDELAEELTELFDLRNQIEEAIKQRLDPKCWKGKKIGNPKTKVKGGVRVNNCVPAQEAVNPAQQAAIAIAKKKAGKK